MTTLDRRIAWRFWLWLGCVSFGGPAGQIALMHRELVERKGWISESRFLHALNVCMLLPGPEALQLATYIGWLMHRIPGGLVAGGLFVLPSAFLLLGLSWLYAAHGSVPAVAAVLSGIKPIVVALLVLAVARIGRRALKPRVHIVAAGVAFVLVGWLRVPFPLIVLGAGLYGVLVARLFGRRAPGQAVRSGMPASTHSDVHSEEPLPPHALPSRRSAGRVVGLGLVLWFVPLAGLIVWRGDEDLLTRLYGFFTQTALLTFGGAYAVLAWVVQSAVHVHGWITPAQAVDGLALAETTPGPLIIVLQHVGFMAGWGGATGQSPAANAALAALVTSYATFLPSFVLVFLAAPYIEVLRRNHALRGALAGVTAAAVGVIGHLALAFGRAVLLQAGTNHPDVFACLASLAALGVLADGRVGTGWVVVGAALLGLTGAAFAA